MIESLGCFLREKEEIILALSAEVADLELRLEEVEAEGIRKGIQLARKEIAKLFAAEWNRYKTTMISQDPLDVSLSSLLKLDNISLVEKTKVEE